MKTYIVLLPVDTNDRNKQANYSEGTLWEDFQQYIDTMHIVGGKILDLNNFMEECNDQLIDLEDYWITYIKIM